MKKFTEKQLDAFLSFCADGWAPSSKDAVKQRVSAELASGMMDDITEANYEGFLAGVTFAMPTVSERMAINGMLVCFKALVGDQKLWKDHFEAIEGFIERST